MPCFFVEGRTGQGKGLCSVGLMQDYLQSGRPVATNMDIFPENFKDPYNRDIYIIRLPDYPKAQDFYDLGFGNVHAEDEDENGLLLLDEAGNWLNSREWNAPGRKESLEWFRQRRKWGWDVLFQGQNFDSLDKDVKVSLIDFRVRASKMDNIRIPVISPLLKKLLGVRRLRWPKWMRYHVARMYNTETDLLDDVHRFFGSDLHKLYDTKQVYSATYPHGSYCYLTPWHLKGRYLPPKKSLQWLIMQGLRLLPRLPLYAAIVLACAFSASSKHWAQSKGLI